MALRPVRSHLLHLRLVRTTSFCDARNSVPSFPSRTHPFRVVKRQLGYAKVRYRGLVKNTAQVLTLVVLSNLWMVRRQLLPAAGAVRL